MNEAGPLIGVVVGHGALAEGAVDAVRQITGVTDALAPISNRGLSPDALGQAIRDRIGDRPAVVFTDLQSGSCAFVARRLCRELPGSVVVTGFNLPLLLDFVMHRDLPFDQLVPRLLDKGRAGICCAPEEWEGHADRALPRR